MSNLFVYFEVVHTRQVPVADFIRCSHLSGSFQRLHSIREEKHWALVQNRQKD